MAIETANQPDQPPTQFVIMRRTGPHTDRFVRNVWWSGSSLSLRQAINRIDPTLLVYTVAEADKLFPNVGTFARRRHRATTGH